MRAGIAMHHFSADIFDLCCNTALTSKNVPCRVPVEDEMLVPLMA